MEICKAEFCNIKADLSDIIMIAANLNNIVANIMSWPDIYHCFQCTCGAGLKALSGLVE